MRSFSAPNPVLTGERLQFLRSVDSPTISNAIEPFAVREKSSGYIGGEIGCLYPELGVMVGQALTVKVSNPRGPTPASRAGFEAMFRALEQMPAPSVIVMQDISGEPNRCAYAGEVMATLATRLGCVGMVSNGGYRDLAEVREIGMHYFAPLAVVSHGNFAIHEIGEPVVIGGEPVRTGDVLHGDENGIVLVPEDVLDALPERVEEVRTRERAVMDFIKSDRFSLDDFFAGRGY